MQIKHWIEIPKVHIAKFVHPWYNLENTTDGGFFMKKLIILLIACCLIFAGCGETKENELQNKEETNSEPILKKEKKEYDISIHTIQIEECESPLDIYDVEGETETLCNVLIEFVNNGRKNANGINGSIDILENGVTIYTEENIEIPFIYAEGGKFYYNLCIKGNKKNVSNYKFSFDYDLSRKYDIVEKGMISVGKCYYKNNFSYENVENNYFVDIKNNSEHKVEILGTFILKTKNREEIYTDRKGEIKAGETKRIWLMGSSEPFKKEKGEFILTNVWKI